MNIKITDTSNSGKDLAAELKKRLEAFEAGSKSAKELLDGAQKIPVDIAAGKPGTGGNWNDKTKKVTMSAGVLFDKNKKPKEDGLAELAESTLFELQNGICQAKHDDLKKEFLAYKIPLITYGKRKAGIESYSTWNVGRIIREMKNYDASEWGRKQDVDSKDFSEKAYEPHFAASPHAKEPDKDEPWNNLPSGELYAYLALRDTLDAPRMETLLQNVFSKVAHKKTKKAAKEIMKTICEAVRNDKDGVVKNAPRLHFYCRVVDFVANDASFATREWNYKSAAIDWQFTDAMRALIDKTAFSQHSFDAVLSKIKWA